MKVVIKGAAHALVPVYPARLVKPVASVQAVRDVPLQRVQVCSAPASVPVRGVEIPALLGIGQSQPEKLPATKRGRRGLSISAALRTRRRKRVPRGGRVI